MLVTIIGSNDNYFMLDKKHYPIIKNQNKRIIDILEKDFNNIKNMTFKEASDKIKLILKSKK